VPYHSNMKKYSGKFWQHGDVSAQRFICRGTTVATGISEVSMSVGTENHSSDDGCPHQSIADVICISIAPF
jgi:hypothetical protein